MVFWRRGDTLQDGKDIGQKPTSTCDAQPMKKDKDNARAKLEQKIFMAEQTPEPIYDISDCCLKDVPGGTYSKCKVMLKEALFLQKNQLTTLKGGGQIQDLATTLKVLDLSANRLDKLPEEICMLASLTCLNVSHNRLTRLPSIMDKLVSIQTLNIANNSLKSLPQSMPPNMTSLDISGNVKLKSLDKSFVHTVIRLTSLHLDAANFSYPPVTVCQSGLDAIAKFFCTENKMDPSVVRSNAQASGSVADVKTDDYQAKMSENLQLIDKQKADRMKQLQALEEARDASVVEEMRMASDSRREKSKLLTALAAEVDQRETVVRELQAKKDKDRQVMLKALSDDERKSDEMITTLMQTATHRGDPKKLMAQMEEERIQMEQMMKIKAGEAEQLRQQEIINEMRRRMAEDLEQRRKLMQYESDRRSVVYSALAASSEHDNAISQILDAKDSEQKAAIDQLLTEEKYQREAFASLLVTRDERHADICQSLACVQEQLANLTRIEVTKNQMKVEFEKELLASKRQQLSDILLQLMSAKEERAAEINDRLREAESERAQETTNYWLIQYQRLLDSKPKSIEKSESALGDDLRQLLRDSLLLDEVGPFLALHKVTSMKQAHLLTEASLIEMGIRNAYTRQKLLVQLKEYDSVRPSAPNIERNIAPTAAETGQGDMKPSDLAPSAPPAKDVHEEDATAHDPKSIIETFASAAECVVCLVNACDVVYLPCGHVCSCSACETSKSLSICPLCRSTIQQRCHLPRLN